MFAKIVIDRVSTFILKAVFPDRYRNTYDIRAPQNNADTGLTVFSEVEAGLTAVSNGAFALQHGARFKRAVSCRARFWLRFH